jgi:predicted RNA-binding Zn ribbon-like protein
VGGALCLDFVNTISNRGSDGIDHLTSYGELLYWSQHAGALGPADVRRLILEAGRRPADAARVLERARSLRELVARLLDPAEQRRSAGEINAFLAQAPARAALAAGPEGYAWLQPPGGEALARPLWPIVWSAADLLTSPQRERVHVCEDDECRWMFVDLSRGHTRRWCSMDDCGNRAKARRHYARVREKARRRR